MTGIYKKLTPSELLKPGREGRGTKLLEKIKNKDPFLLYTGGIVIIKYDKDIVNLIQIGLNTKSNVLLNSIWLSDINGKKYKISDLAKSNEFGGLGQGSGTRAEDEALTDLKQKLQTVLEKENTPYIYIKMGNRYGKVSSVESTEGTPKSDFHLLDEKGNMVFWISHKKGSRSYDFQQYGGMTELAPHPEISKFVKDVQAQLSDPKKFPMKTGFYRPVKSRDLIFKSLYGKNFKASGADSVQNIDVLHQGPLTLYKRGERHGIALYEIKSNHTMIHGEVPTGDYECYFYVRPEQAKTQLGITGARFFIVAKLTATRNKNASLI